MGQRPSGGSGTDEEGDTFGIILAEEEGLRAVERSVGGTLFTSSSSSLLLSLL